MGTYSGREQGIGLDVTAAEGNDLVKLPRLLHLILFVLLTSSSGRSGDGGCAGGGGGGGGRGGGGPVLGDGEDGKGLNGEKDAGRELHVGQLVKCPGR